MKRAFYMLLLVITCLTGCSGTDADRYAFAVVATPGGICVTVEDSRKIAEMLEWVKQVMNSRPEVEPGEYEDYGIAINFYASATLLKDPEFLRNIHRIDVPYTVEIWVSYKTMRGTGIPGLHTDKGYELTPEDKSKLLGIFPGLFKENLLNPPPVR